LKKLEKRLIGVRSNLEDLKREKKIEQKIRGFIFREDCGFKFMNGGVY